jgi:hypothetical protein
MGLVSKEAPPSPLSAASREEGRRKGVGRLLRFLRSQRPDISSGWRELRHFKPLKLRISARLFNVS